MEGALYRLEDISPNFLTGLFRSRFPYFELCLVTEKVYYILLGKYMWVPSGVNDVKK